MNAYLQRLIVAIVAIVLFFVIFGGIFMYLDYQVAQSNSPSYIESHHIGYTEIILTLKQTNTTQFGGNVYSFEYVGEYNGSKAFAVIYGIGIGTGQTFNAVKGSNYDALGLEIQVGEVNNTSLILWVKSTDS
jgi:hypothetical protein